MIRIRALLCCLVLLCSASFLSFAKGAPIKIVIEDENLSSPIEIKDPQALNKFRAFAVPGKLCRSFPHTLLCATEFHHGLGDRINNATAEQRAAVSSVILR